MVAEWAAFHRRVAGLQRSYRPSQLEYDGVFEGAAIFDDWLVLDPPLINAQTRRWNGQLANPTMGRCLHEHWRDNFLYVDHSFDEYTSLPSPLVDAGLAGGRSSLTPSRKARSRAGAGPLLR